MTSIDFHGSGEFISYGVSVRDFSDVERPFASVHIKNGDGLIKLYFNSPAAINAFATQLIVANHNREIRAIKQDKTEEVEDV